MGFCHGFATVGPIWDRFGRPDSFENFESGLE